MREKTIKTRRSILFSNIFVSTQCKIAASYCIRIFFFHCEKERLTRTQRLLAQACASYGQHGGRPYDHRNRLTHRWNGQRGGRGQRVREGLFFSALPTARGRHAPPSGHSNQGSNATVRSHAPSGNQRAGRPHHDAKGTVCALFLRTQQLIDALNGAGELCFRGFFCDIEVCCRNTAAVGTRGLRHPLQPFSSVEGMVDQQRIFHHSHGRDTRQNDTSIVPPHYVNSN